MCKLNKSLLMIMILNLMISNLSAEAPKMSDSNDANSENLEELAEDQQVEINESEGSNFDNDEAVDAKTDDAKTDDKKKSSGNGNEGLTQSNTEKDKKDFDKFIPKILKTGSFPTHLDEISFCGPDMDSVLVLTQQGQAYNTFDFGVHWKSMQTHFDMMHSQMKMNVMSLLQNKNDNEMVILLSKDGENLVTFNCGASVQRLNKGKVLKDIIFHPTDENILAGLSNTNDLMLSKNKGESFFKIIDSVNEFTFARYSDEAYIAKKERIFAIRNAKNKSDNSTVSELIYSDDYFKKWTVALKNIEFFKLTDCCVYVKQKGGKMKVADAFGNFYYFWDLEIEEIDHENFQNFNVVENGVTFQTFGTMVHQYNTYSTNFLMKSNWFGTDFKILFDFLVCDQFMSMCDILPVQSLAGVMMSNRYKEEFVTFREDIPKSRARDYDTISRLHNVEDYKMSFISHDFGETWKRMSPPNANEQGLPFKCKKCHLNLHLHSSFRDFSLPVSSVSMPGLVIATGNVGNYLITDKNDSEVGLFISENGGEDWRMIKRGNYIIELLDNGSLIVVANRNFRSVYLEFSFDSGKSWHRIRFSEKYHKVLSLTTKKSHGLQKLIIDTEAPEGYTNKAKIITVDFSNLHEKKCVHNKDDPDVSDYEKFVPHFGQYDNCFLGQEIVILRKKAERECFNNEKYALEDIVRRCPCKNEDYHCDFGFEMDKNNKCVFNQKMFNERLTKKEKVHSASMYLDNYLNVPKHCSSTYLVTTGYRKNFGNMCTGGQSKETLQFRKCPGIFIKSLSGFVFKFSMIVLILFLVYHFNLHFFLIDCILSVQNTIFKMKKKRDEDKKKKKQYEQLRVQNEQEISLKDGQNDEESNYAPALTEEQTKEAETSRKINSIFDEDDDEEEENPIPF